MKVVSVRENGAFTGQKRVQIFFDRDEDQKNGPSRDRCKPEFFKASRIDVIIKKALRTGMMDVKPGTFYGDFSDGADFLQHQNRVISVHRYFEGLPSETRNFFNNDPKNLLDFVANPANYDEAVKMKILKKRPQEPAPAPPAEPPAKPEEPSTT